MTSFPMIRGHFALVFVGNFINDRSKSLDDFGLMGVSGKLPMPDSSSP